MAGRIVLLGFLCLSFFGCTRYRVEYVYVDPSDVLLEPCRDISAPDLLTNRDLVMSYLDLLSDYRVCSLRMDSLIRWHRDKPSIVEVGK